MSSYCLHGKNILFEVWTTLLLNCQDNNFFWKFIRSKNKISCQNIVTDSKHFNLLNKTKEIKIFKIKLFLLLNLEVQRLIFCCYFSFKTKNKKVLLFIILIVGLRRIVIFIVKKFISPHLILRHRSIYHQTIVTFRDQDRSLDWDRV